MSIDMSQFHEAFFDESFEGLEIMESELLTLDVGAGDAEIINTIFRAAHSIKGGAGTFGFMNVSEFTHVMETLLDEMRDGSRDVTQFAVDSLLESIDVLRTMLESARDNTEVDEEMVAARYAVLNGILKGEQGDSSVKEVEAPSLAEASTEKPVGAGWEISFIPHTNLLMAGNDPVRMFRALSELGELSATVDYSNLQPFNELVPEDLYLSWLLTLTGDILQADIEEVFEWVEDDCDLTITPLAANVQSEPLVVIESEPETIEPVQVSAVTSVKEQVSENSVADNASVNKKPATKPKKRLNQLQFE